MPMWPVRNVMTIDVITAPDDASIAEVAAILAERGISAVPIINQFDVVVGVVSWTDLHRTMDPGELEDGIRGGWLRRDRPAQMRWPDQATVEVMSAPPVTVGPDASLAAAGRRMHRYNIGRLLVTDADGRLLGIVTRRDLLKVHARLDSVIRDEVAHRILRRTLMIEPSSVQIVVHDGAVTLTGHTARKSTALAAVGLTQAVAGVTEVVNGLTFDTDDTARAPAPRPPAHDAMHGWWDGRGHDQQPGVGAVPATRGTDHSESSAVGHEAEGATTSQAAVRAMTSAPGEDPEPPPGAEPEESPSDMAVPRPRAAAGIGGFTGDIVDEWGRQSFPASDPPTNW